MKTDRPGIAHTLRRALPSPGIAGFVLKATLAALLTAGTPVALTTLLRPAGPHPQATPPARAGLPPLPDLPRRDSRALVIYIHQDSTRQPPMKVPLSRPDISSEDIEAVVSVLKTPNLSLGPEVAAFESAVSTTVRSPHAVAVSSGTAGLHCLVRALGIGPGDEVVTSPFSFVASANVMLFEGARPVFADINPETLDLDPEAVERAITRRTKALLPVHVFGRPCRITEISALAGRHGLKLIEDACEALGTTVARRHAGTFGDAGVYAFYPNKQMTTGEGGMIVTGDEDLAAACRSLRNQGRAEGGGWLEHVQLGYNYRLPDILCALGRSQVSRLEEFVAGRERVARSYIARLTEIPGVIPPAPARPGERISWFVFVVRLAEEFSRADRDAVLASLRAAGVECRNYFVPIHLQPFYRERFGFKEGDFPVTEAIAARTIALPFHNRLTEDEVDYVARQLAAALRTLPASKRA